MGKYNYKKHKRIRRSVYEEFHSSVGYPVELNPDGRIQEARMSNFLHEVTHHIEHERTRDRDADNMINFVTRNYIQESLQRNLQVRLADMTNQRGAQQVIQAEVQRTLNSLNMQGLVIEPNVHVANDTVHIDMRLPNMLTRTNMIINLGE